MDPAPAYGSRIYAISATGIALVEEIHQYKPAPGESEADLIRRIARLLGPPLRVELRYQQGRIVMAEARRG